VAGTWFGVLVALTSGLLGLSLGLVSGYFQRFDGTLMRVMDGMMAFPAILLAIAIMAATGPLAPSTLSSR
jgi:peptide/nickel transport system permease protein